MNNKTYQELASRYLAKGDCENSGNGAWFEKHSDAIDVIMQTAPRGSGFNSGTKISLITSEKMVFETSFHHMDENGFYSGWTEHKVTIRPDFVFGYTMKISGPNKNDIKDYIGFVFTDWLSGEAVV